MLDKRIEFEERYDNEEHETTTLYFIAPKELLDGKYPEADRMEISVEFPTNHMEPAYASVAFSPSKHEAEEDAWTDYDWYDVDLPYDEIDALITLALKQTN